ncbi:DNA starvation/stationary phase protection protein [Piscirickettsia salmonis]|uniref:DNA protection during starvation protein n=1 Tax=Piscirickettsia salmonis TaxID=1238 RepID=A0A095BCC8_PISSA|nr:Dps family protein [Piscirickettsia salmonis]AKP73729.1 DNA starvation/stationary phase protection protein [Piscirickettsia salmonis LF-89 = ATCC VR-1361]ALA25216.1 ferritin-like domain protein [Piscirickettsia salmonis]ALB22513.1 ferritin-like domain protein [Piscirickettsia salmonis]ALY02544.1 DNA starvation/stationary phase protection protein [Piscirickettsia salmonis]AMA42086.1 DNA starvation/stationary phase protection protein [Piscirickettsia salmonis]
MNLIGLNQEKTAEISKELNKLLATYQVFYMNVRGFHWNIKGQQFFELHTKFEEIYNDLLTKVDEIAERILTLGEQPLHAYSQYAKHSEISEAINVVDAENSVKSLLNSFSALIKLQRHILKVSGDAEDEGTSSLMGDYIKEQEKLIWMFLAYLN